MSNPYDVHRVDHWLLNDITDESPAPRDRPVVRISGETYWLCDAAHDLLSGGYTLEWNERPRYWILDIALNDEVLLFKLTWA